MTLNTAMSDRIQLLCETNFENIVTESVDDGKAGKKLYIRGIFAESERRNRNGRTYRKNDMEKQVARINEAAISGHHVLGELDHPETLVVNLKNASHKILEMHMDGNNAMGKAEVLTLTPSGQIAKGLIESGVQLGMSTRAAGSVNESDGMVEDFNLITCDLVASPSALEAYPTSIYEHLLGYRRGGYISELAEAVLYDVKAQKHLQNEIVKFIRECVKTK